MKIVEKEFTGEPIHMDFNEFIRCKFKGCTMIYHGFGPVGMVGCSFGEVKWTFVDAASNTIKFMAGIYAGAGEGGKKLIESAFEEIRSGAPFQKH
jgi:hypothetical protein